MFRKLLSATAGVYLVFGLTGPPTPLGEYTSASANEKTNQHYKVFVKKYKRKGGAAPGRNVSGLKWRAENPVNIQKGKAILKGQYKRKDWELVIQNRVVRRKPNGEFRVFVPVTGVDNKYEVIAVGPHGDLEREIIPVKFPEWKAYSESKSARSKKTKSKIKYTVGLGPTYIQYSDSNLPLIQAQNEIKTFVTTVKAGLAMPLAKRWSFGVLAFMNVNTLSNNADNSIRFFGINGRLSYQVPFVKSPWALLLSVGLYANLGFPDSDQYGYTFANGPQFFPVLVRGFSNGNRATFYVKIAPLSTGSSVSVDLSNREFGAGVAYWIGNWNWNSDLGFSLDASDLAFPGLETSIRTRTISLGVSLTFPSR